MLEMSAAHKRQDIKKYNECKRTIKPPFKYHLWAQSCKLLGGFREYKGQSILLKKWSGSYQTKICKIVTFPSKVTVRKNLPIAKSDRKEEKHAGLL